MKTEKALSVLVVFAGFVGVNACVTDNPAAYEGILGPTRESPEGSASAGGTGTGGTSSSGGTAMTGGTQATGGPTGEGGMGDGGAAATSGTSGSAGTTPNPDPHPDFMPPCFDFMTQDGLEIVKGAPCTAADPQQCYRPCGPAQVGWKLEECRAGVYAEEDCRFPLDGEYSCYRLPDDLPQEPPAIDCGLTAAPAATGECNVEACTPCNHEGFYEDTGGAEKVGFCVCRDPDEMGIRRWTCASDTAWPCPTSQGCF
jgi:hypothetical protein